MMDEAGEPRTTDEGGEGRGDPLRMCGQERLPKVARVGYVSPEGISRPLWWFEDPWDLSPS